VDRADRDTLLGMDQPAPDALDDVRERPPALVACPFLVSTAGPWRNALPSRDHRCARDATGMRLELEHQRRYCLGSGGPGCSRFVEARPGPFAPMLPVVLDRGPINVSIEGRGLRRLAAPASVVVVVAAIGALLLARGPGAPGPGSGGNGAVASSAIGSPAPAATTSAAASPGSQVQAPSPTPVPTPGPSATPPASASPAPSAGGTYTVKVGDTLSAIAARTGTTATALAKLNGITNPSYIRVGQVLKLSLGGTPAPAPTQAPAPSPTPTPTVRPTPTPRASAAPVPSGVKTYTVKAGDTLGAIAARFGTTATELAKLNGITDPGYIRVGQVLRLP
jgi:LysM repeat protein